MEKWFKKQDKCKHNESLEWVSDIHARCRCCGTTVVVYGHNPSEVKT